MVFTHPQDPLLWEDIFIWSGQAELRVVPDNTSDQAGLQSLRCDHFK